MSGVGDISAYHWPQLAAAPELPAAIATEAQGLLQEERRAAREQGYAEGLRQGEREAREQLTERLEVLASQVAAAEAQWAAERALAKQRFDALLAALAEVLVVDNAVANTALLDRLIEEATTAGALTTPALTLRLSREYEPLLSSWPSRDQYRVEFDPALTAGEVILNAGPRSGRFDPSALVQRVLAEIPSVPAEPEAEAEAEAGDS